MWGCEDVRMWGCGDVGMWESPANHAMSCRDWILVETEPTHTHPMSRRDMIWDVGYWLLAVGFFFYTELRRGKKEFHGEKLDFSCWLWLFRCTRKPCYVP